MTTLQVWMLGSFEVELRGTRLTDREWRSRQVRTILKYLLTRREHVVTVDQLIELLWPDEDPDAARRRVYVRTSQLRRLLNPEDSAQFVLTVDGGYRINPEAPLWLDVAAFETAVRAGWEARDAGKIGRALEAFEQARALYRGDFLEEDAYEGWTTAERERLREQYLTLLLESAEWYAQQGRYRRALARCRQLLAIDPVREAVYVRMMLYHYHAGERDQALRTYARCRKVLDEELGVEPLPETIALAGEITDNSLRTSGSGGMYPAPRYERRLRDLPYSLGHPPFVGRAGPYRELVEALRAGAAPGAAAIITVTGASGLGKTRLVREALAALGNGTRILTTHGHAGEETPYRALNELLEPLLNSSAGATVWESSGAHITGDDARRRQLLEGVVSLLRAAAAERPLVLFLDDVQWLDCASVSLCEDLVEGCADRPVLWLLAYRDDLLATHAPLLNLLDALRRRYPPATITLTPLTRTASQELLNAVTGMEALPPRLGRRIVESCGGNPFHLLSTVQNLFEEEYLRLDADGARQAGTADAGWLLPTSLRHTLQQRIDRLDDEERHILEIAAVASQPLDMLLLARAARRENEVVEAAVQILQRGHFLVEIEHAEAPQYTISHDQLRAAVYEGMRPDHRQRVHRHVAESVQIARGSDPAAAATLARHYQQGGQSSTAVKYALRAGEHALRLYANQQALTHFTHARQWADAAGLILERRELAALHFHHATALRRLGRHEQAQAMLEKGLPLAQGELKQIVYFTLCSVQAQQGGNLSRIDHVDPELEAELLRLGDSWALAFMWWNQSFWFALRGRRDEARRRAAAGWRVARRLRRRGQRARPMALATAHLGLARIHRWWGAWPRSLWHAQQALALSQAEGDRNGMANAHITLGAALTGLGRWSAAETHGDRCFEIAAAADDPRLQAESHYRRGVIALLRGDLPTAASYADRTMTAAGTIGDVLRLALGQQLEARIAMAGGRPRDALPLLRRQLQVARAVDAAVIALQMTHTLAEALWQAGEETEASELAAASVEQTRVSGQQRELSGFLRLLARAEGARGRWEKATEYATEAEAAALATRSPFTVALARRERGRILLACGCRERGVSLLTDAADTFAALGAAREQRRTQELIARLSPASP